MSRLWCQGFTVQPQQTGVRAPRKKICRSHAPLEPPSTPRNELIAAFGTAQCTAEVTVTIPGDGL